MKQCSRCLRFLPSARFSKNRKHLASQCNDCTNQRDKTDRWIPEHRPLAQAVSTWRQHDRPQAL